MTIFTGQSGNVVTSTGDVPFTGQDLLLYVIVGVTVILGGFALRALAGRRA